MSHAHQVPESSAVPRLARESSIQHYVDVWLYLLSLDIEGAMFAQHPDRRYVNQVLEAIHGESLEERVVKSQLVESQRRRRVPSILLSGIVLEQDFYLVFDFVQRHFILSLLCLMLGHNSSLQELSVPVRLVL